MPSPAIARILPSGAQRLQCAGSTVQFAVSWLAGKVNVQKTTCVPAMQRKAVRLSANVLGRHRTMNDRTSVDTSAPITTIPSCAQPR